MPDEGAIVDVSEGREPLRTNSSEQGSPTDPQSAGGARGADDADGHWRRREFTARTLAARAADQHIARIHLDMAERYAVMADAADPAKLPR